MTNDLQKTHEGMETAREILYHLQGLYGQLIHIARYEISKQLFRMGMVESGDVIEHVLEMISLIERLESLDFIMDTNL